MWRRLRASLAFIGLATVAQAYAADGAGQERDAMLASIVAMARDTAHLTGRAQFSPRVLEALRRVQRHQFVPPESRHEAYANRPLPIGNRQTISQPYIVALSTELLDLEPSHKVLEIGTGSGYQAAVLAEIAGSVSTIEIVEPLGRDAASKLATLGYRNVDVRIGDGYAGWPERAPFDRILVTAAAPYVPEPLLQQLALNGRMVIPVGSSGFSQQLLLIVKDANGSVQRTVVLPVRFVPLTGPAVGPGARDKR